MRKTSQKWKSLRKFVSSVTCEKLISLPEKGFCFWWWRFYHHAPQDLTWLILSENFFYSMNTAKSRVLQISVDKTNLSFASTGKRRKSCPQRKSSAKYSSEGEETANTFQKSLFSRLLETVHVSCDVDVWDRILVTLKKLGIEIVSHSSFWLRLRHVQRAIVIELEWVLKERTQMGFWRKEARRIFKERIQMDFFELISLRDSWRIPFSIHL